MTVSIKYLKDENVTEFKHAKHVERDDNETLIQTETSSITISNTIIESMKVDF